MMDQPQIKEDPLLRDHLAISRTVLANERTFLAFTRTSLTFFVAGVTFIHFFQALWLIILGGIFVPLGVVVGAAGVFRYRKTRREIRETEDDHFHHGRGS